MAAEQLPRLDGSEEGTDTNAGFDKPEELKWYSREQLGPILSEIAMPPPIRKDDSEPGPDIYLG